MHEEEPFGSVITQQYVTGTKRTLACQMRREMTKAEKLLWRELRAGKPGVHFRRQQVIDGFIVDFYCHSKALAIETDGGVHDRPEQCEYDRERHRILGERGIRVLRIRNEEIVADMPGVLRQIVAMISDT